MEKKWTIGEMAKLFDVSADALRYYEREGLLAASRQQENNYRRYSYDDLLVLMDILFYRPMEVPVRDIGLMLQTMGIKGMKAVLQKKQLLVEQKIAELQQLDELLTKISQRYALCEENLGQFSIVAAPSFRARFEKTGGADNQAEDMIEVIRRYKVSDRNWMEDIDYMLLLPEMKADAHAFERARFGISFSPAVIAGFSPEEQAAFCPVAAGRYLYTVLQTDYQTAGDAALEAAGAWLRAQGERQSGPGIGRYLASVHKDGFDYYEIWLPLAPA